MISIITCSKKPAQQKIQERNIEKTIGVQHEYLLLDTVNNSSIASAYNFGVTHATGDIIVFLPDDVYFMKPQWGQILYNKFNADPTLGLIGTAGTQYLFSDKSSWTAAGRPFIKGRSIYHLENGDFFAVVFSKENGDFNVVACDGIFMAVRASLLQQYQFDAQTFEGNSFFDLDFCMQIGRTHRLIVTTDIILKRRSQPVFDKEWQNAGQKFLTKHSNNLPLSCSNQTPDSQNHISSNCVNLKGKFSSETIC